HDAGERGLDIDGDGALEFYVFSDPLHSGIAIQATGLWGGVGGDIGLSRTPFRYFPGRPIDETINYEPFLLLAYVPEVLTGQRDGSVPFTALRFDIAGYIHYAWLHYSFVAFTTNPLDIRYRVDLHEFA